MAGDLIIEEGDLEVLRDRTNGSADDLEPVTVATTESVIFATLMSAHGSHSGHESTRRRGCMSPRVSPPAARTTVTQ